jgi:hypothetical protein
MFSSCDIANLLWFREMQISGSSVSSTGQSGIVYAFWGAFFSLLFCDTVIIIFGMIRRIAKISCGIEHMKVDSRKKRSVGGWLFRLSYIQ